MAKTQQTLEKYSDSQHPFLLKIWQLGIESKTLVKMACFSAVTFSRSQFFSAVPGRVSTTRKNRRKGCRPDFMSLDFMSFIDPANWISQSGFSGLAVTQAARATCLQPVCNVSATLLVFHQCRSRVSVLGDSAKRSDARSIASSPCFAECQMTDLGFLQKVF